MCRFLTVSIVTVLTSFACSTDLHAVYIKGTGGTLAVVDGEVVMAPPRLSYGWRVKLTEKGCLLYQDASRDSKTGRIVIQPAPFYLSCDRRGKLFLAKEPGEGSYWNMPLPPSRKDPDYDDGGASRPGPIRCKFGSLAVDEKNPVQRDVNGLKLRLYPVRVVEKEGEISYRFVVSTG
jgi:hypothetical protein